MCDKYIDKMILRSFFCYNSLIDIKMSFLLYICLVFFYKEFKIKKIDMIS